MKRAPKVNGWKKLPAIDAVLLFCLWNWWWKGPKINENTVSTKEEIKKHRACNCEDNSVLCRIFLFCNLLPGTHDGRWQTHRKVVNLPQNLHVFISHYHCDAIIHDTHFMYALDFWKLNGRYHVWIMIESDEWQPMTTTNACGEMKILFFSFRFRSKNRDYRTTNKLIWKPIGHLVQQERYTGLGENSPERHFQIILIIKY